MSGADRPIGWTTAFALLVVASVAAVWLRLLDNGRAAAVTFHLPPTPDLLSSRATDPSR
jgi:hypothetical protein